MTATRCLFVPVGSWGDDPHISFGIHLEDENFDGILCGCCGGITDRGDCIILWEEYKWGDENPLLRKGHEYVNFNIDMSLFEIVDSIYQNMKEVTEKNS